MKRFIASLAAAILIAAPLSASASTLSDLQAKLQSLLSQAASVQIQINALQAESAAAAAATTTPGALLPYCLTLQNTFGQGSSDAVTGGEVSKLQKLLAQIPALYPEGLVTGYFGPVTGRAVFRLEQQAGLVASSSPAEPGIVGRSVRQLLSQSCSTSTPAAAPAASATTGIAAIAIDRSSLLSSTSTPAITGTAANLAILMMTIDAGGAIVYKNDSIPVTGGSWSATTSPLMDGAYKVTMRSPAGNAAALGYLVIGRPVATSTVTVITSPVPATPPAPVVPPARAVTVNGSSGSATVASGGKALIAWSAQGASSCTASSDNPSSILSGSVPTYSAGSSTGSLFQTSVFTITCASASGGSASGSVTVAVASAQTQTPATSANAGGIQKIPLVSPLLIVPAPTPGN